jgi:uncharacterized membrane protein
MLLSHPRFIKYERFWLIVIFTLCAIVYCLISLVNHYLFHTAAFDLGIFNNALYCISHFRTSYLTLNIFSPGTNLLGDHFSPIMFLYIPFYYLFGSYTLLLIQIASILFGGWGIYKYCKLKFPESYIPLIITLQFFGIWGIYSALSFDFHNNVVGAMFVPWLVYYYEKQNKKLFLTCFLLILISKENMALWLAFIMVGLMLKNGLRNFKKHLKFEVPLLVFALIYFYIVVSFIMPPLQHGHGNYQLYRYEALGNSLPAIIKTILEKPGYVFGLLFNNSLGNPEFDGIKTELHYMVLMSGGLALLYRPYYLFMLLPIYAQKLLSSNVTFWGINAQYSIEFVPILSLALADTAFKIKPVALRYAFCIAYTIITHIVNIHSMDERKAWAYNKTNTRYYNEGHYNSELNLDAVYYALKLVPDDVPLSVSSSFAPHLANREKIYSFPDIKDAQYLVLMMPMSSHSSYPLSDVDFLKAVDTCKASGRYLAIYDANKVLILKKK